MNIQFWYLSSFRHFWVTDGFDWIIYDFLGVVVCNIVIYTDELIPTLTFEINPYSKCDLLDN